MSHKPALTLWGFAIVMEGMQDQQNLGNLFQKQKAFFQSGGTRSYESRVRQLNLLEELILKNEKAIVQSLYEDLRKPEVESFTSEIAFLIEEIRFTRKHLKRWMQRRSVQTPLHLQPGRSQIYREPLGVVLVIGPWNYPFQLAIAPLIGAIAAGNCVIVKPSELAPATSALIRRLLSETFASEWIGVVEGGVSETTELLRLPFDHIFFTGSTTVGRVVMRAAAENLTPVTLELGGKSPTIVTEHADLELAARRIVWGKFVNAGQTCVAPDYVFVRDEVAERWLQLVKKYLVEFFGDSPQSSADYGRIINARNFDRLQSLISEKNAWCGGYCEPDLRYIAPTILTDVTWQDPVMKEEIFGPVLPVLEFKALDEVFATIRAGDKPLSAYFFSESKAEQEAFLENVAFGGACINDTLVHLSNPYLPFGGVGASGMGAYHGEKSFLTFSHEKSVLRKSRFFDFSFRYPPYDSRKAYWLRKIFRM